MNYKEAIDLIKEGNEKGYVFLYESTYQSKYYLALKYMKDDEAAKDVLQDAYIKAFEKLDTLENPEAFSSWLGQIVANNAKNMLAKNSPMRFADVAVDDQGESVEYQIEDDNVFNQPEIAYTKKETQELVHELLNSLSEEQRLCVLMFHIEGESISEIATAMNCSENTVKSRLNYGRKNLKKKAEELQKKGYKLYSIAPLPLLLWLLRTEKELMIKEGTVDVAGKEIADNITNHVSGAGQTVAKGVGKSIKTGFIHSVAGKVTVVAIGMCMIGTAFFAGKQMLTKQSSVQVEATEQAQEQNSKKEASVKTTLEDSEYPTYIAGHLSKDELQFVLAYGPEEMTEQGISESEYPMLLTKLCTGGQGAIRYIKDYGYDAKYLSQYFVEDVNRLFYSFTSYQYSQGYNQHAITVDGSMIKFAPATLSSTATAVITDTKYSAEEIEIYYTFKKVSYELGTTTTNKRAVLRPINDGTYRIVIIEEVKAESLSPSNATTTKASEEQVNNSSIKDIYQKVLQSVQNKESGYQFTAANSYTGEYRYFIKDIDGDGILDLIVGATYTADVFNCSDIRAFTCNRVGGGYELKALGGEVVAITVSIAGDGNGLFNEEFSRGSGQTEVYRITISNNTLSMNKTPEMRFTFGDSTAMAYNNANPLPEWLDITDYTGLALVE